MLFRASAEILLGVAASPKHLGAPIGFLRVLHSWGRASTTIPISTVWRRGAECPGMGWNGRIRPRRGFFLPVRVLSRVFRGKFVAGLKRLFRGRQLPFHGALRSFAETEPFHRFLRSLFQCDWVVYAKKPFGGPEQVLQYLACYRHRVAISNHHLLSFADGQGTFRWKDEAHGSKQRKRTLVTDEFLRRFLLPVLPRGFMRIRHFGFLANRQRGEHIAQCRRLLLSQNSSHAPTSMPVRRLRPLCAGVMEINERLTAQPITFRHVDGQSFVDTS